MCKNKLHVCTCSMVRFTLRFANLFTEVSRVCIVSTRNFQAKSLLKSIIKIELGCVVSTYEITSKVIHNHLVR